MEIFFGIMFFLILGIGLYLGFMWFFFGHF